MSGEKRKERMNLYRFRCLFCRRLKYISFDFHLVGCRRSEVSLSFKVRIAEVEDGQTKEDGEVEEEAIPGGGCRR